MEKKKIRVPLDLRDKVIKSVTKKLNVKDVYRLKDRFDGHFYLKNQFKRIYSSYFFQKELGIKLLSDQKPLFCKTEISFEEKKYSIVGTYSENKIKIPKKTDIDGFLVTKIVEHPPSVQYLGKISYDKAIELSKNKLNLKSNNLVVSEPLVVINSSELK